MEQLTRTKNRNGRRYHLDQIYWDKIRANREAVDARKHGYYSFVVPVMYEGEKKYARYTADKVYVLKKPRTRRK